MTNFAVHDFVFQLIRNLTIYDGNLNGDGG